MSDHEDRNKNINNIFSLKFEIIFFCIASFQDPD